ncbi:MAG: phosphatase PAP2 family protein [Actinomycetes bacterium]
MTTGTGTRTGRRPAAPLVLATALGTTALFALLTALVVVGWSPLEHLDHRVVTGLTADVATHPWLVDVLQGGTDGLSPWVFRVVVLAPVVVLLRRGEHRPALWALLAVWGGGLLVAGLKVLVDRERPTLADPISSAGGFSYPSGHALGATVGCAVLLALAWPHLGRRGRRVATVSAVTVAGFVSFTRVALGVHFTSDVLAGALLGLTWLAAVTLLVRPAPGGKPL